MEVLRAVRVTVLFPPHLQQRVWDMSVAMKVSALQAFIYMVT